MRRLIITMIVVGLLYVLSYNIVGFGKALALVGMLMFISSAVLRYFYVGNQLSDHVRGQAKAQKRSLGSMWGQVFKKTALYLFLPAAVLTTIMVLVALFVTRNQR